MDALNNEKRAISRSPEHQTGTTTEEETENGENNDDDNLTYDQIHSVEDSCKARTLPPTPTSTPVSKFQQKPPFTPPLRRPQPMLPPGRQKSKSFVTKSSSPPPSRQQKSATFCSILEGALKPETAPRPKPAPRLAKETPPQVPLKKAQSLGNVFEPQNCKKENIKVLSGEYEGVTAPKPRLGKSNSDLTPTKGRSEVTRRKIVDEGKKRYEVLDDDPDSKKEKLPNGMDKFDYLKS